MTRKLGENQRSMLWSLREHRGEWFNGCGWLWDTPSGTAALLDSLLRRGLVERADRVIIKNGRVRPVWRLTKEGRRQGHGT